MAKKSTHSTGSAEFITFKREKMAWGYEPLPESDTRSFTIKAHLNGTECLLGVEAHKFTAKAVGLKGKDVMTWMEAKKAAVKVVTPHVLSDTLESMGFTDITVAETGVDLFSTTEVA